MQQLLSQIKEYKLFIVGLVLGVVLFYAYSYVVSSPSGVFGNEEVAYENASLPKGLLKKIESIVEMEVLLSSGFNVSANVVDVKKYGNFFELTVDLSSDLGKRTVNLYLSDDTKYLILSKPENINDLYNKLVELYNKYTNINELNFSFELKGHVKGNRSALVSIVEFSDFECPYCGRFYRETYPLINQNYVDSGKVAFYYRHYPLTSIHPSAFSAAKAAYCADKQGKFWEYHDLLFNSDLKPDEEFYVSLAKKIGLDVDMFKECFSSKEAEDYVNNDLSEGMKYGVRGTPSFFLVVDKSINREKVIEASSVIPGAVAYEGDNFYLISFSGALPYDVFDRALSILLS